MISGYIEWWPEYKFPLIDWRASLVRSISPCRSISYWYSSSSFKTAVVVELVVVDVVVVGVAVVVVEVVVVVGVVVVVVEAEAVKFLLVIRKEVHFSNL